MRNEARQLIGSFVEVFVDCPMETLIQRDVKGLYTKALHGEIPNFTGVSDPYEPPEVAEVVLDTSKESVEESCTKIVARLDQLGYRRPPHHISLANAMRIATVLEWVWRLWRFPGEPPLTRYAAGILGYSQTYDITAAKQDLGYQARVSLRQGLELVAAAQLHPTGIYSNTEKSSRPLKPHTRVRCRVLCAGTSRVAASAVLPNGGLRMIDVPVLFGWIEHPTEGTILFDTGYSPRIFEVAHGFATHIYRWLTRPHIGDRD